MDRHLRTQQICEQGRLIETAFAFPGRMERDRNDEIETAMAKSVVIDGGKEPARHQMPQMELTAIFEIENDAANNPAAAIGGDGSIKMQRAMLAIRAAELACDRAGKRLRAFCAKRGDDARGFGVAFAAKIFALSNSGAADGADRWIKERCNRGESVKLCERRHISTSRALASTSSRRRQVAQFRSANFYQAMEEPKSRDGQFY